MNEEFMQYVLARIEKILRESKEYMELQSDCVEAETNNNNELAWNISNEMEFLSQKLCYVQGFNDAMQLMMSSKGA